MKLLRTYSGYLLSCIANSESNTLENITHVMLDEIHERDVKSDFILGILKAKLDQLNIKLIVMSATLNTDIFENYFSDSAVINIIGRSYDVEDIYLDAILTRIGHSTAELAEDSYDQDEYVKNATIIASLISNIHRQTPLNEGILVFQPGAHAIELVQKEIDAQMTRQNYRIFIVHSEVNETNEDAMNMFKSTGPSIRKIVLATNVAETSITIENMVSRFFQ